MMLLVEVLTILLRSLSSSELLLDTLLPADLTFKHIVDADTRPSTSSFLFSEETTVLKDMVGKEESEELFIGACKESFSIQDQ